jgi:serine/threonine protein kinase/tetratricopeptide (TPR) repeat protein
MADPFSIGSSSSRSPEDLLADWNLGEPDDFDQSQLPGLPCRDGESSAERAHESCAERPRGDGSASGMEATGISQAGENPPGRSQSMAFFAEFEFPSGGDEWYGDPAESRAGSDLGTTLRPSPAADSATALPRKSGRNRPPDQPGSQWSGSRGLPRVGDRLAGFRILQELGRGAFARVYLAEEILLKRLVAIKVSRAEGDEPQILARLQHTNIVPVHSVFDDPATALRILCMPYLGGASLAQVLDAAGGLVQPDGTGRSLVEALDQISRSLPSVAAAGTLAPRRSLRSVPGAGPAPPPAGEPACLIKIGDERSAAISGFRSFLSRLVGTTPAPSPGPGPLGDDDQHQPSRQFLRRAGAVQAAVWIVARLAEGLDHAHSRGLLHRDLKPANILLAADGTPMLLDFNLAAERGPESLEGEIRKAMVGGTLQYMAPEHLDAFDPRGSTPPEVVDERADIYALGLIFFEMLAGEPAFPSPPPGTSVLEALSAMMAARKHPPSIRARCPIVPWSLDALVAKCLEFDPMRRYSRARDLAEDLRRFLDDQPMKHCSEPSTRERVGKFARRHPVLCSATSITLVALSVAGALFVAGLLALRAYHVVEARLRFRDFDWKFTQTEFRLHTAGKSAEYRTMGIQEAGECFRYVGLGEYRPALEAQWIRRLPPEEQSRIREQTVELVMLEAQARVAVAQAHGSEDDRRRALERAITRLDQAERLDPHVPAALFADRAGYYAALGDKARADRDREHAAKAVTRSCHDWILLGTSRLLRGDRTGADEALRKALFIDVTSFWAWFMMGHCDYAQGKFIEAAGDFSVCCARGPSFAWTHFNRGLALARAGKLREAKDAYDTAIMIDSTFGEARVDRALVELELNDLEPAYRDLTVARSLGRTDLAVLVALGETLSRMGRRDEAEQYFAQVLTKDPDNAVARVAHGVTLVRSNPEAARSEFTRALEQDPQHAAAHYGMALLVRASNPSEALAHLNTALDTDPRLIDALQLRALVRARMGDRAALDDVDRLKETPTAHRLYNAACAAALYAAHADARDPGQLSHAVELLGRALQLGFPAKEAASDPDLQPLHGLPEFRRLLSRSREPA